MLADPATRDPHPLAMIEAMTRCAYELGLAASEIAQRAGDDDTARFLSASAEFRQCFFAVRMGIRLTLAQRAAARAAGVAAPVERERERPEAGDPPERERDDAGLEAERERDREGDYEPVSLPQFLKTLRGVAAPAEQGRDDLPAHVRDTTLPALRDLLVQAKAPPDGGARSPGAGSAVAMLNRPPAVPAGRSRLLASTVTPGIPARPPTVRPRRPSG